jgi:hypothetical protein
MDMHEINLRPAVKEEIPEEAFLIHDPIGLTFASGIHERDLLAFLERSRRLAGEVC